MTKNAIDEEPLTPTPTDTPTLAPEGEGAPPPTPNRQRLKKIALIVVPLIFCAIAGTIFFFKVIKSPKAYKEGEGPPASESAPNAEQVIGNSYIELKEMLVNLSPTNAKPNYLKISIVLQLTSNQDTAILESKMPIILDSYYMFLKELRAQDFNNTGNVLLLKAELLKRANKISAPIVIKDVLFKEMIIN